MGHTLSEFLHSFIDTLGNWKTQLLEQWPMITHGFQTKIVLEKIENDRLIISVSSSAWLQEMYFFSDALLTKINATLDKPRINKLHFKYKSSIQQKKYLTSAVLYSETIPHSVSEQQLKVLSVIQDQELQEYLKLFLIRCKSKESNVLPFTTLHTLNSI